jgi:hypothetical protein
MAGSPAQQPPGHLADPFATGWMLVDTNGDGLADFIAGKIVVPANSTAAENAAAANLAARLGYGTTGLTPPVVITAAEDKKDGPRIYINQNDAMRAQLLADEGGVFESGGNLFVIGNNDAGLLAAAEAYAARVPYAWKVPGDKLPQAAGITYAKGKTGVNRVFDGQKFSDPVAKAEASAAGAASAAVRAAGAAGTGAVATEAAGAAGESAAAVVAAGAAGAGAGPAADAADAGPQRLDLATLYTMRGLFRGTARMPIPSNLDAQLYVPAGAAGVAMANLAARMGLETTGITLPLAVPAAGVAVRDVRTKAVIAGDSDIAKEADKKSREEDPIAPETLAPGEGELRIVDKAFGRQSAVLVRGDDAGSAAALGLLADRMPNLWDAGKPHLSLEEIRYDLHRFFSLRSAPGQAAVALYWLDKWMPETKGGREVQAAIYTDIADEALGRFASKRFGVPVTAASLHAGTQCCDKLPALHSQAPGYAFHQGKPAFQEDIVIPWEGTRLIDAVKGALGKLKAGAPVKLVARVSEGPAERRKLQEQLTGMLPAKASVVVLCAFKQGYSWLIDEVAPQLKDKNVASIKIEFRKNEDASGERVMFTPARWVQELYPVDEVLARELKIPLEKIELSEFTGKGPTYRVHAFDAAGREILSRAFTVTTVDQPYNGAIPRYEQVQVSTGWVRMESGTGVVLDRRIKTDIEEFWDHYQNQTLVKVFKHIMAQSHGELRPEFAPPFDTLKIDFHLSEPDYDLGIDKERISSLEALQEDTFYTTENFVNTMSELEAGRAVNYAGRIIPIVHRSEDGQDGRVHIEFYGKPAANPMLILQWTDAAGEHHERKRDMTVLSDAMQPRLVQARAYARQPNVESLTWLLPADYKDDKHDEWIAEESADQVERSIFSVEQARGQIQWLGAMQASGLYRNELSYPHLHRMAVEFELPVPRTEKVESAAPRESATWMIAPPALPRPTIAAVRPRNEPVQWDEPISPAESAGVLAKLATQPGVTVYWMGRSYLGQDVWAADVMLPSPALLRSVAKETTLKASILYSGRQHANEVSSTSHLLKLGEQLVSDAETRAMLKQVNVILHPITNPDGAQLSVELAGITPDNMLHPGYHGALAADITAGQAETDPVYPESRTRRQLLETWLPDAFLNPHGYPSHEWVQPFSEYTGWVTTRQGANNGRTWWIPRGWFTSLTYLRDPQHPYSEKIAYEIRDRIVEAERAVPGLLDLENRMNARYQRFGQRWQPRNMQQPIVNGIRIYMALKGSPGRGGAGGAAGAASGANIGATGGVAPDITWDSGYTEAPDETAHGDYMKLMARAGLAFDRVHLSYLAGSKLRITHTEREQAGKITLRMERLRPNLPAGEPEPRQDPVR